jgi:tetratricopeptide (TPR) repeat protein
VFLGLAVAGDLASAGERSPYPPEAREQFDRGQELLKKGRYQEAVDAFDEAMRRGMQDFPRAHLYRANSNLELKDYDRAIAQYTELIDKFGIEESCRY